jgi:hypothetical protein
VKKKPLPQNRGHREEQDTGSQCIPRPLFRRKINHEFPNSLNSKRLLLRAIDLVSITIKKSAVRNGVFVHGWELGSKATVEIVMEECQLEPFRSHLTRVKSHPGPSKIGHKHQ